MTQFTVNKLRVFAVSDTHGRHRELQVPPCDVMIHAGDVCEGGDEGQLRDFFDWYVHLPIKHKLFVHGNHDLPFDIFPESCNRLIPDGVTYLNNAVIEIEGVIFVGIEATMSLLHEVELDEGVDVLIAHCPPQGILDNNAGCPHVRKLIFDTQPSIALFGHIHERGGCEEIVENIRFVNVSMPIE